MLVKLAPFLLLKMKHLWQKTPDGSWYYRRRLPKDIVETINPPSSMKVICLRTADRLTAATMAAKLAKEDDEEWSRIRKGKSDWIRIEAEKVLNDFGIDHRNPKAEVHHNKAEQVYDFYDYIQDAFSLEGMEKVEDGADPADHLPPHLALAFRMACGDFKASDALAQYLELRGRGKGKEFAKIPTFAVNSLIETCGDRKVELYRRADVNKLIGQLLDRGQRTATVRRRLNALRTIFDLAIRERELSFANPFDKVIVPGEGGDVEDRKPFDEQQLEVLRSSVSSARKVDDRAQILGMLLDTGARLAEIVGAKVDDLELDGPVPILRIRNYPHRRLKTGSSERTVPLVGEALRAASLALEAARKQSSEFLFARYTDEKSCNANAASATLNKRIKSLGIPRTCHSLRHSMRDRLRAIGCPEQIIDRIGGWSTPGVGGKYGTGYPQEMIWNWLAQTVKPNLAEKSVTLLAI